MTDIKKSTDAGLSNAERKELRSLEAKVAITDYEDAQKAFHENRERLRGERLAREAVKGPMLYPAPELPDDTPVENVRFSTRIRNALNAAGLKTIGEIREASDATLNSLPDLGPRLGRPSSRNLGPPVDRRRAAWAEGEEMKDSGSNRRLWTPEDQKKLDALLDAGREAAEIAVTLNRTRQAVYARLQRRYRKQTRLPALSRIGRKAEGK